MSTGDVQRVGELCQVPQCAWVNPATKTPGADPLSFWKLHFQNAHPAYMDAITGYRDEDFEVRSYDGSTVLYHLGGLQLRKRRLYLGFSANGYAEDPGVKRAPFQAIGGRTVWNEDDIAVMVPHTTNIRYFAIFESDHTAVSYTGWRPMPSPILARPGDTISFPAATMKVTLVQVPLSNYVELPVLAADRLYTPPMPGTNVHLGTAIPATLPNQRVLPLEDLGYHVAMHPRFGWTVWVDLHAGGTWEYWRPTRKLADDTGYKRLLREVAKRERSIAAGQVRSMRMRDLRATGNDPKTMKDWEEEFNAEA